MKYNFLIHCAVPTYCKYFWKVNVCFYYYLIKISVCLEFNSKRQCILHSLKVIVNKTIHEKREKNVSNTNRRFIVETSRYLLSIHQSCLYLQLYILNQFFAAFADFKIWKHYFIIPVEADIFMFFLPGNPLKFRGYFCELCRLLSIVYY